MWCLVRVWLCRDVQRDQDELREFVDNKMLRIGNIEKERARNKV